MDKNLSFKVYLESARALHKAAEKPPTTVEEYEVTNYCRIPLIGESTKIKLKPKDKLLISWLHEDRDNPKVVNMDIQGKDNTTNPLWNDKKMLKWLISNTNKNSD